MSGRGRPDSRFRDAGSILARSLIVRALRRAGLHHILLGHCRRHLRARAVRIALRELAFHEFRFALGPHSLRHSFPTFIEGVPELRIVKPELWDTVQRKLEEVAASPRSVASRVGRFWEQRRARHLLSGLVRCGCCGSRFQPMGATISVARAHIATAAVPAAFPSGVVWWDHMFRTPFSSS